MANSRIRQCVVAHMANGTTAGIHLHEFGDGSGPTVGICAAIHGNEPTGTRIIMDLAERLTGTVLHGRLLLLPVANPLSFEANTRHTPIDDQNLNRLFPGDRDGWFSEQLAAVISVEFLTKIDVLIDLHSGGDRPTVDYVYIKNAEHLSRSFGSRVLYRPSAGKAGTLFTGTSVHVTETRGVPSVTVELGGGLIDQGPYVERGVSGIINMLRALKVLDGSPTPPPEQIVVSRIETIRPRQGGFLETLAPPLGQSIERGALLGRVVSPYTFETLEEIENPVQNGVMILSHLTTNLVQPGDYGYMVGSAD